MPKQTKKAIADTATHPNVRGRVVPKSYEAEQAVLGSVMLDDNQPVLVLGGLKPEDFHSEAHQKIWEAMQELVAKGRPIDIATLTSQIDVMGNKDVVGGAKYIASLTDIVPSSGNFRYYSDIVRKNSVLRRLIRISQEIMDSAYAGDDDDSALAMAESKIFALAETNDKSTLAPIQEAISAAISEMEALHRDPLRQRGVPTPYRGLNNILGGGFQAGDLVLIAARPGQGKTALGMNLIAHAALSQVRKNELGKPAPFRCAVFSLEMPAVQLVKRVLCGVAKVDLHKANSGRMSQGEWNRLFHAKSLLTDAFISIDDSSLINPAEILSKCRRLKRDGGLDLIMIDYLQLMSGGAKRFDNRQQEVSDITRSLKIAAKELGVPIILLSQVNREVDKRADRQPQMSDLRESGAIEQDADIIIFIYKKYDNNAEGVDPELLKKSELIVAKHRNGITGRVAVRWEGAFVSFVDEDATMQPLQKSVQPATPQPIAATLDQATAEELDDIPL